MERINYIGAIVYCIYYIFQVFTEWCDWGDISEQLQNQMLTAFTALRLEFLFEMDMLTFTVKLS